MKKPRGTPFQKGNPGGPGRPKGGHSEWAKEVFEREGKEYLLKWMRSTNAKASMAAVTLLMSYAYGKPTEHHEVNGTLTWEQFVGGTR